MPVRSLFAAILTLALLQGNAAMATATGPLATLNEAVDTLADPQGKAEADAREAAAAFDKQAAEVEQRLQELRAGAADAPARNNELSAQLAIDPAASLADWEARLPPSAGVEVLEAVLEQERVAANQLRDQIQALTAELSQGLAQPARSGLAQAQQQRRLDELDAPVSPAADEPASLSEARQLRNNAERRKLQAELAYAQAQQDLAGTRQRQQELELRVLRHLLELREPRLALLQQRIVAIGREQLEAVAAGVRAQAEALDGRDPVVKAAMQENLALAEELVLTNERLSAQRRALVEQEQALQRDLAGLGDSRTRLELGERSEQVGTWLWAELRRLEPQARLEDELDQVRRTLGDLRLRLIGLNETQRDLDDIPDVVRELRANAAGVDDDGPVARTAGTDLLAGLLEQRLSLADQLEPLIWRRITALEQSERSLQARLDANTELRQTLDRHLLWIRSHAPVGEAWLAMVPEGLRDLVKPSRFVTTAELVQRALADNSLPYLGSLLLVVALLLLRRRARPRLTALAAPIREVRKDSYRNTLEALGWTVAAALPGAVTLLLVGWLLQDVGSTGKYSDSLGRAFEATALPLFTLSFLRWLVRERGLAHAHFRWTKPRRDTLRRWLPRMTAVLLPLYFVVALAFMRNQELAISVQARGAIVLISLASAWALWQMLAPERLWHTRGASSEPSRLRKLLRLMLPAGMLAGAALALSGYVYSSALLLDSQFASVGVVTAVAVVHGLLSRWFLLGERRLALRRMEQKREAEAEARAQAQAGESGPDPDSGEAVPLELDEEITLEKVSAHSRSLLRALKLSLLVLGLAWVWAEVLPAFARFDEITLWSVTETAADGVAKTLVPVSLMAVLLGLLALALTFVAARNLPGLIEIGLLSRVNIDAASRYAITSVSRYVIVLVGLVLGLGLLGLRWGQLQWMAAALTVGLGFGLQEIFANFVSGLILLFERPFRVGDVITVNNLDGTVTRIRTRATTILDFDNKEIVVPNKSFITGQLVNWTLSDETTRITIKVGVDYGTDPALVHRLLIQAAEENPRVLRDWPPRSWLMAFGASTLDFELRVFVGSMGDRLAVRNELNTRLIELFEQNEIAFAYPQLDVHVRDVPELVAATRAATEEARPAKPPRKPPQPPAREPD
ncbi:mechanosensitive ion channel domain-containing protein [Arenimonas sp. MALMAid1274]|uniref:mechanosensitive ion channel domain-containing protein n=1 Tax=Arenimonas sp. MALMAid1274 TaxID=3411630 RepID=UPI003BA1B028